MPYRLSVAPASDARLGPATPPIVVAQTIIERCRPYSAAGARSTAAYRAWRLAALPAPKRKNPANKSGTDRVIAARTTRTPPSAATRYDAARLGPRPRPRAM